VSGQELLGEGVELRAHLAGRVDNTSGGRG
jgi:hypothetical protein